MIELLIMIGYSVLFIWLDIKVAGPLAEALVSGGPNDE